MASTRHAMRPLREVVFRPKCQISRKTLVPMTQTRLSSSDQKVSKLPPGAKGPNEDQLPHVSEEQAAMDKSMGNTPPDLSQGTPVQEILSRDKDAKDSAPEVIKKDMNSQQKRSYSTSARRMAETGELYMENAAIAQDGMIRGVDYPDAGLGHKFALPRVHDISGFDHLKRRYDPVVDQVTKSIMRDGKLSVAQKHMSDILTYLRTAPAPQPNPAFPQRTLLISESTAPPPSSATRAPTSPFFPSPPPTSIQTTSLALPPKITPHHLPRSTLPLHPIEYLTTIIDSVSPLIKIRQQRGIAGGGASTPIPVPLGIRQRRRQAIQWILSAADGRREVKLGERVAKELVKVADGTSSVWERRAMAHRLAVSARSNVRNAGRRR